MDNYMMIEINSMRDQGIERKEYNENSIIVDNNLHFDCNYCFEFAEGKVTVCYEKTQQLLIVDYKYKAFHSTHLCLIELSDLRKSWCVIDESIDHFMKIQFYFSKQEETEGIIAKLNDWKDTVKAEIFIMAFNYYFDSKANGAEEMRPR